MLAQPLSGLVSSGAWSERGSGCTTRAIGGPTRPAAWSANRLSPRVDLMLRRKSSWRELSRLLPTG